MDQKRPHLGAELICLFAQNALWCVNNFRGERIPFNLQESACIHFNMDEGGSLAVAHLSYYRMYSIRSNIISEREKGRDSRVLRRRANEYKTKTKDVLNK